VAVLAGIARAMKNEFDSGFLPSVRDFVRADVFADFLEMADYLLSEGYKDPSAVITGAVLEDSLRQLCNRENLPITKPDGKPLTIEPMNVELAKAKVYDKLVQKQVTSWADLRNKAAHGHFEEYDDEQVRMMLLFVQKFASDYLR
jgi:hypothetical protein